MKRVMELWSVTVVSMKLAFAQGEMTSRGRRGPKPQRPCTGVVPEVTPVRVVEVCRCRRRSRRRCWSR